MKPTLLLTTILLTATSVAQTAGWTSLAAMTTATPSAPARKGAVAFSIGTKGYICTGEDASGNKLKDLWEFNASTLPGTQVWTQRASLDAVVPARSGAIGFAVQGNGYMGTGEDANGNRLSDFYKYDTITNTWSNIQSLPGLGRSEAVGFAVGNKGYAGLGKFDATGTIANTDFYELDPSTGNWTVRAQFPVPGPRIGAVGFGIGFHGYVGTGMSGVTQELTDDFWLFDPSSNQWGPRPAFPGTARAHAIGFGMVGYGFIGTGNDGGNLANDFFRYDAENGSWTQAETFGGVQREGAVGFSIGDRGFIATGDGNGALPDLWQFVLPIDCEGNYGGSAVPGGSCSDGDENTIFDHLTSACTCSGTLSDHWAESTSPPSNIHGRRAAVTFTIGSYAYMAFGEDSTGAHFYDFWRFDPSDGSWGQAPALTFPSDANIPSLQPGLYGPVAFSIGFSGYIGTGHTTLNTVTRQFWEFNSLTNTWTRRKDFGGYPRQKALGFSINGKGYIGLGQDSLNQVRRDFWEYDPVLDDWTQVADFDGGDRAAAVSFTIGNHVYVGTGNDGPNGNGTSHDDLWEYFPTSSGGYWRPRATFSGHARYNAAAFGLGSKGYLGTGMWHDPALHVTDDFYEFDPTDATQVDQNGTPKGKWTRVEDYGGVACYEALGFSVGQTGYVGTGLQPLPGNQVNYRRAFYAYTPATDCDGVFQGPHRVGMSCDDQNPFTENDTYNTNCLCKGTCINDVDGDGICDEQDNCPNAISPGTMGSACNDGNGCTVFDALNENCQCTGDSLDTDFDGIPNCADNCPATPGVQGGPCDDQDPCTTGTTLDLACNCTGGTTVPDSDNDGVCNTTDACPNTPAGSTVNNVGCACSQLPIDDGDPCTLDECLNFIPTHTVLDVDGDGICDAQDPCPLLAFLAPGDPCPCANPCDINCFVTAGCNCLGTFSGHSDNDGICDALDNCPLIDGQIGSPCTDSDLCYIDGVIDANCECHGTNSEDHDGDGTCDALDDDWEQRPSMSFGREDAVSFAIGDSGYITTGQDVGVFFNDLWRYYPGDGSWSQKANLLGTARHWAVGFAIGTKGYVCGGRGYSETPNGQWFKDLWEYDPSLNAWTQKSDIGEGSGLPALGRAVATGFAVGGKGHVAGGYGEYVNNIEDGTAWKYDMWQYDPSNDQWSQVPAPPHRMYAVGFAIGDKGYMGMGYGFGGPDSPDPFHIAEQWDLYEFDPSDGSWTQRANLPGPPRTSASAFSIGSKGYVVAGRSSNAYVRDCWKYDPALDSWTRQTDFRGGRRESATAFVIGDTAYVGTGLSYIHPNFEDQTYMGDLWRFHPSGACAVGEACDDNDACTSGETWDANCICSGGVANTDDLDQDGVPDCSETATCLNTPAGEVVIASGCSCSQMNDLLDDGIACTLDYCVDAVITHIEADSDNDGICDALDSCPYLPGQNGDACGGTACLSPGTIVNCVCNATAINPQLGDTYATRIPITLDNAGNATVSGNNLPCFTSTYSGAHAQASPDVWYTITTGSCASGNMTLSTCSAGTLIDTYLHVLDATGTSELAYNDDIGISCSFSPYRSALSMGISPNTTYIIVVEGFSTNTGTFSLNVTVPGVCVGIPTSPEIVVEQPVGTALSGAVAWGGNGSGQSTVPVEAQSGITAIAGGWDFSMALKSDGSVIAWGMNDLGQTDVPVSALSDVTAIAAGGGYSLALKGDGSVIAWGDDTWGQTEVPSSALTGVIAIAAAPFHCLALKNDGSAVAWGRNVAGEATPPLAAQDGVVAIAGGWDFSAALKSDGSVISWGTNNYGQSPAPLAAHAGVVAIATGYDHILALKDDGSVIAWGANSQGQTTVPPSALSSVTAVAACGYHSLAIKSDGSVIAWGQDNLGQSAVPSVAQSGIASIAAGREHSLAMKNALLPLGFGDQTVSTTSAAKTFTIRNTGNANLIGIALNKTGANPTDFTLDTGGMLSTLPPGGSTTFTVTFTPGATGARGCTLNVVSNDNNENPYSIGLTGNGVPLDTDGDGVPDASDSCPYVAGQIGSSCDDGSASTINDILQPNCACFGTLSLPEISVEQPAGNALSGVVAWGSNWAGETTVPAAAQTGVTAVSAGGSHTLALKSDGSVIAWGNNASGQTNVPATAQSGIVAISAGEDHSLALKSDGSVIAWGWNDNGQTNVPSAALSNVVAVAAGAKHSVALKSDGSVIAWGDNSLGQTSVPIEGQSGVTAIAAGRNHTVALKSDGRVIEWGLLVFPQPVPVEALSGVVSIAAGWGYTVALKTNGSVIVWGLEYGSLLVPLEAQAGITAIAAGGYRTLALKTDGSVIEWSYDDGLPQPLTPVPIEAQTSVDAIAAGFGYNLVLKNGLLPVGFSDQIVATTSAAKTFTIRNTGNASLIGVTLYKSGANPGDFTLNTDGMLSTLPYGGSTTFSVTFTPGAAGTRSCTLHIVSNDNNENPYNIDLMGNGVPLDTDGDGVPDATDNCPNVVGQIGSSCNDGNANTISDILSVNCTCVGFTTSPEIVIEQPVGTALSGVVGWGLDSYGQTTVPAEAQTGVTAIAAGQHHTLALKSDGSVIAWGDNSQGQTTVPATAQTGVIAIAAGQLHSLALKNDGSVIGWGNNGNGLTYVLPGLQSGVIAIASESQYSVALKSNGRVYAWDYNYGYDITGEGSGVIAIAAGGGFGLALKSDGSVMAWGTNSYGQTTVPAAAASGVIAIAAGYGHALSLKNDGSVVGWGHNADGQTTVPSAAASGVTAIAAGYDHSLALKSDGSVVAWGDNFYGQLTMPVAAGSGITAIAGGATHTLALKNALLPVGYGDQVVSTTSTAKTFTIRNTGNASLTGLAITKTGANPGDFTVNTGGMLTTIPPGGSTTFSVTFTPSATGTRGATLHIANNDNNENPYDIDLTGNGVAAPNVQLSLKVLLEGPYNSVISLMSDALRAQSMLPLTEPYTGLGYSFVNGGGETTTTGVLQTTGSDAIVDWVIVELRPSSSNTTVSISAAALVQRDGDMVAMDGISPLSLATSAGDYYVVVRHRDHLGVMTAAPVSLSAISTAVDLTLSSTVCYGTNARKTVGGRMVLWAGDVSGNGVIKYTGSGNDRDPILVRVGSTTPNNSVNGYHRADVNMDGITRYTGSGNDRDPILVNVGSTTPNSIRTEQLP